MSYPTLCNGSNRINVESSKALNYKFNFFELGAPSHLHILQFLYLLYLTNGTKEEGVDVDH